MSDEIETVDKNQKSWAAWKREAERLQAIIDDMALAAMDSEPVIVVGDDGGDALSYRRLIQSFEPGTKLYLHAQPAPVVPGKWIPVSEQKPDCWCRTCRPVVLNDMRFVVCPDCWNKRCPRANDHRNACTGSNEPGQEGSAYPDTPQEVKGE